MNRFASTLALLTILAIGSQSVAAEKVCAWSSRTYNSSQAAAAAGEKILHCGKCGACSNLRDVGIYGATRQNLTTLTTRCAFWDLVPILGKSAASRCLKRKVGFTRPCHKCWMENIACTRRNCAGVCALEKIAPCLVDNLYDDPRLRPCLKCDKVWCGKKFEKCAGATRRRAGILTDIPRQDDEICALVDPISSFTA